MLAKNISPEEQQKFIQELLKLGFRHTAKDLKLAIHIANKKEIITQLLGESNAIWSLPHDIRKHIAIYLLELFKTKP